MKKLAPTSKWATRVARLVVIIAAAFLLAAVLSPSALMQQEAKPSSAEAERMSVNLKRTIADDADKDDSTTSPSAAGISPDLVTAGTYAFSNTSAIALEDMSSGTTQLVGPSLDDNASAVTNIGFDYWYDGVRMTQFSVNANGLLRLGGTAVSTGFTNSLASVTDAPKIGAYWDDQCTGSNGKAHFKVIGSAPSRKLIVEWQNMQITRGAGCVGTGNGTYQIWLFETSGVIEFVYGSIQAANAVDGGYSVGLQSGAATNFASVTTTGSTVSYAAANNAQTNAITSGTAYLFTPNIPAAPTGLNFTATAAVTTTLNWTDNATNEVGYAIYRSTDGGVSYSFLTQTAANAVSFTDNTVSPATNYFYRVLAVTEGGLSAAAQNNVTTNAAGNISSVAAGGLWSLPATWVGGVVPTVNDNATIVDGATVTIDTAAVAYTVTVGTGGAPAVLQFEPTTARTLTVGTNVSIATNGTLQSAATLTQTGHVLSVGADLVNNGVLDLSTNANTAGAILTFTSATNNTFSGTGATTDLRSLTVNKGIDSSSVIDVTASSFTVQGVNTDVAGFLTLTNGTLKISGTFTVTNRVFTTAAYTIGATAGFWLNNSNFTVAGQNGSPTNNGLLRVSQGTFNVGTSTGNSMGAGTGAVFTVEGGTSNYAGRLQSTSTVIYNQSGGTVNVCTVGQTAATACFGLSATTNTMNMTGGTIVLVQRSTAATPLDYRVDSVIGTITNTTLQIGSAATTTNFDFRIRGSFGNLVIDNTTNAKSAVLQASSSGFGNMTLNTGTLLNLNGFVDFFTGATVVNNGTINGNTAGSRLNFNGLNGTGPQTYSGTGVFGTNALPAAGFGCGALGGLTLAAPIVTLRVNLFQGSLTGANQITIGNGGASTETIQVSQAANPISGSSFDVAPTFNIGTGGLVLLYLQEPTPRTTGLELPPSRTILSMQVDNTSNVTLAGGDLTLTSAAIALTLNNGRFITGANTLSMTSSAATVTRVAGHVDGNFRKNYSAAASKLFEVGTANGFSPVTVNATGGTFPADFTVKAVQGPQPNIFTTAGALQRYWTLSTPGTITADLTFNYLDPTDLTAQAESTLLIFKWNGAWSAPGGTVNTAANTATITGVSSFSDWTLAAQNAPTATNGRVSGQVVDTSGEPIAGTAVRMIGTQNRLTITDAEGNYHFDNVETNGVYTVTPARANFVFAPSQRSFSLVGASTDATFTGTFNGGGSNSVDSTEYFVRQQYLDFLNREPDEAGFNFWVNNIESCGSNLDCRATKRVDTSAAFFLSIEFKETGYLVDRMYKSAFGNLADSPVALTLGEFRPDTQKLGEGVVVNQIGWQQKLDENKQTFASEFVQRARFTSAYPTTMAPAEFVDRLFANAGVTPTDAEMSAAIAEFGAALNSADTAARGRALRQVAENSTLERQELNHAFVLMQYFGYLRRDPNARPDGDFSGYSFWLDKLDNFGGDFRNAEMVKAFLVAGEYRARFVR